MLARAKPCRLLLGSGKQRLRALLSGAHATFPAALAVQFLALPRTRRRNISCACSSAAKASGGILRFARSCSNAYIRLLYFSALESLSISIAILPLRPFRLRETGAPYQLRRCLLSDERMCNKVARDRARLKPKAP